MKIQIIYVFIVAAQSIGCFSLIDIFKEASFDELKIVEQENYSSSISTQPTSTLFKQPPQSTSTSPPQSSFSSKQLLPSSSSSKQPPPSSSSQPPINNNGINFLKRDTVIQLLGLVLFYLN